MSRTSHGLMPAPALAPSISHTLDSSQLRKMMRDISKEKAKRIFAQVVGLSIMKAAENALLEVLQIGFKSVGNSLKNSSFHFIEIVLKEVAQNGNLDYFFLNIKLRTGLNNQRLWAHSQEVRKCLPGLCAL